MWSELETFHRQRLSQFCPKADLLESPRPNAHFRTSPAVPVEAAMQVAKKVIGRAPTIIDLLPDAGGSHVVYRARWQDGSTAILRFNRASCERRDFPLLLDGWAMDVFRHHGLPALQVLEVDLSRCL